MNTISDKPLTLKQAAAKLRVPVHRIRYAMKIGCYPKDRIGNIVIVHDVEALRAALKTIVPTRPRSY